MTDIVSRPTAQSLMVYGNGGGVKQFQSFDGRGFVWTFNTAIRGGANVSISQREIAVGTPEPLPANTIEFNPTWNLNFKAGDVNRDNATNAADSALIKVPTASASSVTAAIPVPPNPRRSKRLRQREKALRRDRRRAFYFTLSR